MAKKLAYDSSDKELPLAIVEEVAPVYVPKGKSEVKRLDMQKEIQKHSKFDKFKGRKI